MKIKEIAFVAYAVTNLPRARAFYEGFLGLTAASVMVKDDHNGFIEYWIGAGKEHCLAIGAGAPTFKPGKVGATAALEVDNIEDAARRVADAGIKTLMPRYDGPMCSMLLIEDPDGNQLMLHQRKQTN